MSFKLSYISRIAKENTWSCSQLMNAVLWTALADWSYVEYEPIGTMLHMTLYCSVAKQWRTWALEPDSTLNANSTTFWVLNLSVR